MVHLIIWKLDEGLYCARWFEWEVGLRYGREEYGGMKKGMEVEGRAKLGFENDGGSLYRIRI